MLTAGENINIMGACGCCGCCSHAVFQKREGRAYLVANALRGISWATWFFLSVSVMAFANSGEGKG